MPTEQIRLARVESAEVEEAQRPAVDEVPIAFVRHVSRVQIPIRDVVAFLLQDVVLEESRHQVDPALIGDHHARDIVQRVTPRRRPPPLEKRQRLGAHRDEPEIVGAGGKDDVHVDSAVVSRERVRGVRRQHNAVLTGERRDFVEGIEDANIRIEVDHFCGARCQHRAEKERLDGRRQLRDLVDASESAHLRAIEAEIAQPPPDHAIIGQRAHRTPPAVLVID